MSLIDRIMSVNRTLCSFTRMSTSTRRLVISSSRSEFLASRVGELVAQIGRGPILFERLQVAAGLFGRLLELALLAGQLRSLLDRFHQRGPDVPGSAERQSHVLIRSLVGEVELDRVVGLGESQSTMRSFD